MSGGPRRSEASPRRWPASHLSGITTFNCSGAHGLFGGNKFRVIDSTNNNLGDYIVKDRVGVNTFTALTPNISAPSGHILKHGLSSNEASSDSSAENLGTRSVSFFDNETLTVVSFTSDTTIQVSSSLGSILKRFPLKCDVLNIKIDGPKTTA